MEWFRVAELVLNSALLAWIATLTALPLGIALSVAFHFNRFAGRNVAGFLILFSLCWPLPVTALAWQIILGDWLSVSTRPPGEVAWQAWNRGLLPAGLLHGIAGWPIVTVLSIGLFRFRDRNLEAMATLELSPWAYARYVRLPLLKLCCLVGSAWVCWQTFTEIQITDMMMVRTFAEEIYTQLVGGLGEFNSAIFGVVGFSLGLIVCFALLVQLMWKQTAALSIHAAEPEVMQPESSWRAGCVVWCLVLVLVGLPVSALVSRAGGATVGGEFSVSRLIAEVSRVATTEGWLLIQSLAESIVVGSMLAALGWASACYMLTKRASRFVLGLILVLLAAIPGPLLGFLLKRAFLQLIFLEESLLSSCSLDLEFPPVRSLLYDQPTPVPAAIAALARWLPLACLLFLPGVKTIPTGLLDQAALAGFNLRQRIKLVVWPYTSGSFRVAIPLLSVLCLGEVSTTKIVNPPFRPTYILRLYDMMHYGAETTVAVLALGQVLVAAVAAWSILTLFTSLSSINRRT